MAAKYFRNPHYEQVARQTLDFMIRELSDKSGAMIASLSALDKKGVEGGYYLWRPELLSRLLTSRELKAVRQVWGMMHAPSLQAGHLPVQSLSYAEAAKKIGMTASEVKRLMQSVRQKLLKAQSGRSLPRDTKVLAAWNGLALRSFSLAGQLPGGKKYRQVAQRIRDYIVKRLWRGNSLARSWVGSKPLGTAGLQDYAQVSSGLYLWAKLYAPGDKKLARKIARRGWQLFYSKQGWKLATDMVPGFAAAEPLISDRALPSPSASLIRVSLQLAKDTRDKRLKNMARSALNVADQTLASDPWWFATHIRTIYELQVFGKLL